MQRPDVSKKSQTFGILTPIRPQVRRAFAAWRIVTRILKGMHRVAPLPFWVNVFFGVVGRFAVLGQFAIILYALMGALSGTLTPRRTVLFVAVILAANIVRFVRLKLQRSYTVMLCLRSIPKFRSTMRTRKLYKSFKGSLFSKSTRCLSIVESVVFATVAFVFLFWISAPLAASLLVIFFVFLAALVFFDMTRSPRERRRHFETNLKPIASAVRSDVSFNMILLVFAAIIQSKGGIDIEGLLIFIVVFGIRYLVVYMRELQRSVVFILDLASRRDLFIQNFMFDEVK